MYIMNWLCSAVVPCVAAALYCWGFPILCPTSDPRCTTCKSNRIITRLQKSSIKISNTINCRLHSHCSGTYKKSEVSWNFFQPSYKINILIKYCSSYSICLIISIIHSCGVLFLSTLIENMYVQWLLLLIQLLAGCGCCFYLSPCIVLHRYLSTCITAKLSNSPSIKLFSCVANIASEIHFLFQCVSINIIVNISAETLFRRTLQIMPSKHFCSAVHHIIQITGFCKCATLKGFFHRI